MKKVLFLMFLLFLMVLGVANVRAQVRIGGNTAPSAAAVLDLNVDDSATPATNKGALALPRVSLASTTAQLNGAVPITGMLVYNTNASMTGGSGVGVYFYNGSNWIIISGDGIVGNELTDTITGGGLNKTGTGTTANPYKVGIKTTRADSGLFLQSTGSSVKFATLYNNIYTNSDTVQIRASFTPVSWSIIMDTTVYMSFSSGQPAQVIVTGLTVLDMCRKITGPGELNMGTGTDVMWGSEVLMRPITALYRIRCYRPNI